MSNLNEFKQDFVHLIPSKSLNHQISLKNIIS